MTGLDHAKHWYDRQYLRIKSLERLCDDHSHEVLLRDLLSDLVRDSKSQRKAKLKAEREDLYRVALIRLFAGFEADFRALFLAYMVARTNMTTQAVGNLLPDAISALLMMYRALEPKALSESLLGQINRIRDERNRLAHGGIHQLISPTTPEEIYGALKVPLAMLYRPE